MMNSDFSGDLCSKIWMMDFFFKRILKKIFLFISLAMSGLGCSMGSFVVVRGLL